MSGNFRLETITFDDTSWNQATLAIQPTVTLTNINGTPAPETLVSTIADEVLSGQNDSDIYEFSSAFGNDIIDENGSTDSDLVRFIGFNSTDATFTNRLGYGIADLKISFATGESLIIKNFTSFQDQIENYEFTGDATTLNVAQIQASIINNSQTIGNDIITGYSTVDTIDAGSGDDLLNGGDGSDTYVYTLGDGNDTIEDNGSADTDTLEINGYLSTQANFRLLNDDRNSFEIKFNNLDSITILNSVNASFGDEIEQIIFIDDGITLTSNEFRELFISQQTTSGDDVIYGFSTDDVLMGSTGNDFIFGLNGSDTYQYNLGDGHDRIEDNGSGDNDIIEIYDYLPVDVSLHYYDATDTTIVLSLSNSDSLTIVNTLADSFQDGIEQIVFIDDPSNTIWTNFELRQMLIAQMVSINDDRITAFTSADTLVSGSTGTDRQTGYDGADIYQFSNGDEMLIAKDFGSIQNDILEITGYSSTDAVFNRLVPGSNDLLIEFNGSTDRIIMMDSIGTSQSTAIEIVKFNGDNMTLVISTDIEPGLDP